MLVYQRVSDESKLFSRKSDESVLKFWQAQGISRKKDEVPQIPVLSFLGIASCFREILGSDENRTIAANRKNEDSPLSLGFSCKRSWVFIRWLWTIWIISKRCHTATTFGDATSYEGYPSSRVQPLAARPYVRSSKQYLGQQLGWLSVLSWICLRHPKDR